MLNSKIINLEHDLKIFKTDIQEKRNNSYQPVSRSEWEVVKVLVKWMSGGLSSCIWRLVDQHCVNCTNVRSSKALNIVQDFRKSDVLKIKDYYKACFDKHF